MNTLLLLALLLPSPAALAQSEFGEPVKVNGVLIEDAEIKRHVIYGPCRPSLEWRRINALLQTEIERRVAAQEPTDHLTPSDEEFARIYTEKISEFQERFPTLDVSAEVRRAYRNMEWYRRELEMDLVFDNTFIPDDPDQWPALTFEALRAEAGDILIDDFRQSYERRSNFYVEELAKWEEAKASYPDRVKAYEAELAEWERKRAAQEELGDQPSAPEEAGAEPGFPQEDAMYRSILRQMVRDMLFKTASTKTSIDGLPADTVMALDVNSDGTMEFTWSTEEIWNDVKDTVTSKEIDDAKHFLAKLEAARQRMAGEEFLITSEDSKATMTEKDGGAGFQSAQFNIGMVAVGNHQFPSVESYSDYYRVLESHRRKVEPSIVGPEEGGIAEPLREHLVRANKIMGLGKVDCEVLLVSAYDFPNNKWLEGGWEMSKEKADWIKEEIERNNQSYAEYRRLRMEAAAAGEDFNPNDAPQAMDPHDFWSLLIDEYCGYWDPPQPEKGRPGSAVGYKQKGRFGERYRNDLQGMIGESPFVQFVSGHSITDYIFFEQQVGTIAGPFKGPHGYYLTKVMRRMPPTRPLNVADERHLDLLRKDYIPFSLIKYCEEAYGAATVEGI
jgi:hypothetical protein